MSLQQYFDIFGNTVICFLAEFDEKIDTTLSVCKIRLQLVSLA